jgi:bifunctional non-homologous end joining protein LigD
MGVVEIHTWNATDDDVERPNRIVWDLDPGPSVGAKQTAAAARLLREVLETLKLEAWIKTTGGRGLHIVVPIKRVLHWSECLAFSRAVSDVLVRANPDLYTTAVSKRGRERKILIDYLRNNRTNTSICAYSPRARVGAPVSLPIDWSDIPTAMNGWTVATVRSRLQHQRHDPWEGYWAATEQRISKAAIDAIRQL